MKEFEDFKRDIMKVYGNNYQFKGRKGELGAFGMTREEIYETGYSIAGFAPKGEKQLIVLPLKVFFRERFLQEKLFILFCRKTKRIIREHLNEFCGSTIQNIEITESGLAAALIIERQLLPEELINIVSNSKTERKEIVKKNRLIAYIKEFNGYDLTSAK